MANDKQWRLHVEGCLHDAVQYALAGSMLTENLCVGRKVSVDDGENR